MQLKHQDNMSQQKINYVNMKSNIFLKQKTKFHIPVKCGTTRMFHQSQYENQYNYLEHS